VYTTHDTVEEAQEEFKYWSALVSSRVVMPLPAGLVGYRLGGPKGGNIVPIARETGAIVIIIPIRGPPREVR
jgi:hypothetical protein